MVLFIVSIFSTSHGHLDSMHNMLIPFLFFFDKIYLLLEILDYTVPKRYETFQEKVSKPIDSKVSNIIKIKAKIFLPTKGCENILAQVQQSHGKIITMFYSTLYSILL